MKIKNIAINILAVILLPICVFWYFAFNDHFDGCTVPFDDTKACEEQEECNKKKGGKKNGRIYRA